MRDFKLLDAELVKEDGKYYITTKYRLETDSHVSEVVVKKVPLPLNQHPDIQSATDYLDNIPLCSYSTVDLGYGRIMIPNTDDPIYIEKVIEEKVEELTVEEIEKRIGHKIKIVSKEVHIKSDETCGKCYYSVMSNGGNCKDCSKCDNKHPIKKNGSRCRCLSIKLGDPCPYFKEVT